MYLPDPPPNQPSPWHLAPSVLLYLLLFLNVIWIGEGGLVFHPSHWVTNSTANLAGREAQRSWLAGYAPTGPPRPVEQPWVFPTAQHYLVSTVMGEGSAHQPSPASSFILAGPREATNSGCRAEMESSSWCWQLETRAPGHQGPGKGLVLLLCPERAGSSPPTDAPAWEAFSAPLPAKPTQAGRG